MLKSSIIYLFTSIVNRGIPFLILPLLTHYLLPAEYGYVALFQLIVAFLYPLLNLNGNLFLSKEYYASTKEEISLFNGNYVIIVSLFTIGFLLVLFILKGLVLSTFNIALKWWTFALLSGIFNSIYLNYITLLRCQDRPIVYAAYEIGKSVVDVALTLLFVISLKYGWEGRAGGIILAVVVLGLLSLHYTIKNGYITFHFDKAICKRIFKFCLPLIPFSLGTMIINFSDRIFVEKINGVSALGIYSVAYTLGMSILVFTESFNKAWGPVFFKAVQNFEANRKSIFQKIFLYIAGVLCLPLIIYGICKYVIFPYYIDIKYSSSLNYVMGIAFAYAFQGIFLILYPFLVWKNKTNIVGTVTIVSLIINLLLNYFLITNYGLRGAVWSTLLSYLFMMLLMLAFVVKLVSKE